MDKELNLSAEELLLLQRWGDRPDAARAYLGFCTAVFLPLIAFAIYGALKRDSVAVLIGFGGLMLFELWRICTDLPRFRVYRSLAGKIMAAKCSKSESCGDATPR